MYLEIKGKYALFSRHEFKIEKISYEVPTPSAMIGVLESIYWKPEMNYEISEIHVINKPTFEFVIKNGQSMAASIETLARYFKKSEILSYKRSDNSTPMSFQILTNVHYIIKFRIVTTGKDDSSVEKHQAIFVKRANRGQCYRQPYLGTTEFTCDFNMIRKENIPKSNICGVYELGIMLHHIDYDTKFPKPVFYKPIMRDGVINISENSTSREGWLFEELCNFYDENYMKYDLPLMGYSNEKIAYKALINKNAEMMKLEPLSVNDKGKVIPTFIAVPEAVKGRTSGIKACFAYDNVSYIFGLDDKNGEQKQLAFIKKIKEVMKEPLPETDILIKFLEEFSVNKYSEIFDKYRDKKGNINLLGNIIFQIEGEEKFIHELPKVQQQWTKYYKEHLPDINGICGVSGKYEKLTNMHAIIKGVSGSGSFAKLISVNSENTAFSSYNWQGLDNSNMSVQAAHKYSNSLNWLLSQANHRISVGNSTFVFWTDKNEPSTLEYIKYMLLGFMGEKTKINYQIETNEKLYIIELKANASRLIVGGFNKFKLIDSRSIINYCLKASGILKNGKIKCDWDYISEQKGGDNMNEDKVGYKLGELFAILEKAQKDAVKNIIVTKTIVNKYIQKASASPSLVFPRLLEDSTHHTNKVDYGMKKKIAEKLSELEQFETPFPRKLNDEEKCLFHMGYYKMNNKLYDEIKKKAEENKEKESEKE